MQLTRLYKGSAFESKLSHLQDKQRITMLQQEVNAKREEHNFLKSEINQLREMLARVALSSDDMAFD